MTYPRLTDQPEDHDDVVRQAEQRINDPALDLCTDRQFPKPPGMPRVAALHDPPVTGLQRFALGAEFALVYRGFSGCFPAAGCFDQATVGWQVFKVQPDDPAVNFKASLLKFEEDFGIDPFVAAVSDGGC